MSKIWLLIRLSVLFVISAMLICGLIWLVQQNPHQSPAFLPTIYLFIMPLILGNVLLLSWCQIYNFKHADRVER
jgi:hypothetical protein